MKKLLRCPTIALVAYLISIASVQAAEWQIIGWNDLGMHCMDGTDFSVFSILPPYNTIHAQIIHNGALVTTGTGLAVTFEAIADPDGSINTTSADKINFWDHVADMFGAQPSNDVGLTGVSMPGSANTPQPMEFEAAHNWFTGEGIPLSPFDDAGNVNYYPMMKVVVRNSGGTLLASCRIVLPLSDEMTCSACHQSGSANDAKPLLGWRWHPNHAKDIKLNILRLHDQNQQGNPVYFQALINQGYNTNGLYQTVIVDGTAILCARCHVSNALPVSPEPGLPSLTQVMHGHHGQVIDPSTGMILDDSSNRDSCYRCHPGSSTRCLRGAMGAAVAAEGGLAIECQSCHGTMSAVGAATRNGWFDEPTCQGCHTGTALDNNGAIRFLTVFEPGGAERVAVNDTFAHPTNVLYRFSTGHGDLQCSACHGSPHAIFPSSHVNDNLQNIDMQGHKGTGVECMNCHTAQPRTFNGGPHGMHPVGNTHFATKQDGWPESWFHGKAKEDGSVGLNSCKACHGSDYSGTVLSLAQGDRTIVVGDGMGTKYFWKGYRIGCYSCHLGPNNDHNNPNAAPSVVSTAASTTANVPVAIPLTANEGSIRIISQPQNGTVGLSGSTAIYYPFLNFTGSDSFTFAAWDGQKDSNLGAVLVTVGEGICVLICESLVPENTASRTELPFWANAFVSNCVAEISYVWRFGDGSSSTIALAQHAYGKNGSYDWSVIASVTGLSVTNAGTIVVGDIQLDTDGDGIEDDWEWIHFQSLKIADASSDFDRDGQSDQAEYLAGTLAKDADSKLVITDVGRGLLRWSSAPNRIYTVNATTSLVSSAFAPLATGVIASPPENSFTDPSAAPEKFYRIELE